LPPRVFDTLLYLIERRGELIGKRALMRAIWGATVVADNSLDQNISMLRRALQGRSKSQKLIVTERGRGFRFVGNVTLLTVDEEDGTASASDDESDRRFREALALIARPSRSNLRGAFELLTAAIERCPKFGRALAERALLRTLFPLFEIPMNDAFTCAEREARQALALDSTLGHAHQALAYVFLARASWVEAKVHLDSACRLEESPDAQVARVGLLSQAVGHHRLALEQAKEVYQKVPLVPLAALALAGAYVFVGQDTDALAGLERVAALGWPETQTPLSEFRFLLAVRAGRFQDAVVHGTEGLSPAMRAAGGEKMVEQLCTALRAPAHRSEAIAAIARLLHETSVAGLELRNQKRVLIWLTMLRALDEAFDLLWRALDDPACQGTMRGPWAWLWLPEMRPFRSDVRFQAVIARFGFMEYWKQHGPPDGYRLVHGKLAESGS
jgi:DNA-binding winged helix-turn-helix (wHTH) protein